MPSPYRYKFTVFTPVYNRAGALARPWKSLQSQTCHDFEWIVVDDGSTDNVLEVLRNYARDADFPVRILTQRNSGKHIAWNRAAAMAQGELFISLDSDDECVPTALQRFAELWDSIDADERPKYSGINVLSIDGRTGETVGDRFPGSPFDSNNLDLKYIHCIKGEKWGCTRTDLVAAHPFPDQPFPPDFPANYLWFLLARHWQVRCVNEALRIYHLDLPDRMSLTGRRLWGLPCAFGYSLWHFRENFDYLMRDKRELARTATNIWRLGLHLRKSPLSIARELRHSRELACASAFLPAGAALAVMDRVRGRV